MPVVLVVGQQSVGKTSLLDGLEACSDSIRPSSEIIPDFDSPQNSNHCGFTQRPFPIVTKYYSTQIDFWEQDNETSSANTNFSEQSSSEIEGIIVVFDLSKEDSFVNVKHWGEYSLSQENLSLKLLVATKVDLCKEGDELGCRRTSHVEWCLDHGFEYIEVDCKNPLEGGATREKEGIPRVLEAIHSTLWSSIETASINVTNSKSISSVSFQRNNQIDEQENESFDDNFSECIQCPYGELSDEWSDSQGSCQYDLTNKEGLKLADKNLLPTADSPLNLFSKEYNELFQEEGADDDMLPLLHGNNDSLVYALESVRVSSSAGNGNSDADMLDFDRLLYEMQRERKHIENLPDDLRRERASAAANRIMHLMGNMDIESSSSSENE